MRPFKTIPSALLSTLFALVLTDARGLVIPARTLLASSGMNGVLTFKGKFSPSAFAPEDTVTFNFAFTVTNGFFVGLSDSAPNSVVYAGLMSKTVNPTLTAASILEQKLAYNFALSANSPYFSADGFYLGPHDDQYLFSGDNDGAFFVETNDQVYDFTSSNVAFVSAPTVSGCWADQSYPDNPVANLEWYVQKDFTLSRAFPYAHPDPKMTTAKCAGFAHASNSPYFGIEKGTECWFGSASTTLEQIKRFGTAQGDNLCVDECSGDKTEMCGGKYSFNLYATADKYVPSA